MKPRSILVGMSVLAAMACYASASVGYVNVICKPGDNLVADQLYLLGTSRDEDISWVAVASASAPIGTTASRWDAATRAYSQVSVLTDTGWSSDFTFHVGEGIKIYAPSQFIQKFEGQVYSFTGIDQPPPVFTGQDGVHLLACIIPWSLGPSKNSSVWTYVIGRDPKVGEQFTWLDSAAQQYHTTTFRVGGWDNGEPSVVVGQSAFYNIGPVPEPATVTLLVIGAAAMLRRRR